MDVGTVQSPAVNVTMPGQKAGTPVPAAESKPLAPMQVPIGANGLDSAAGTRRPVHYFRPAPVPTSMSESLRILQIQGFVMLRDPCLFLRKSHVVSENFGGISHVSAATIYAIDMDVGTVQSPAVNVTMPGQRQGRRFPQQNPSR